LHHELSSILIRKYPELLAKSEWLDANPSSFSYLGTGVEAIKEGKCDNSLSTADPENGFINEYSKASFEDDFNEIAECLFDGDRSLWKLSKYPRVRKKLMS
jgi:hypothetical protein